MGLIVVDPAALGQQSGDSLGGVVGAAASDADQGIGTRLFGQGYSGIKGGNRRVRATPE